MGAMEPKNETVPDMFFPFPSNDRCVVLDKLTKDKQVFRAMKSIWLFSNYMRAGLTERIVSKRINSENISLHDMKKHRMQS